MSNMSTETAEPVFSDMSTETTEQVINLGIHLVDLPPHQFQGWVGVAPAIQRRWSMQPGVYLEAGSVLFRCQARVRKDPKTGAPVFSGPYCFGNPDRRFLYLSWDGFRGGKMSMFRRLQVPLSAISWDDVAKVTEISGGWLMATARATAPDGGPAFADAQLLGGRWRPQIDS